MLKMPAGPSAYFDVDDTLIQWDEPTGTEGPEDLVQVETRGVVGQFVVNRHNLNYLIKLAKRGHAIIVWSAGGSDWAEAVVKALGIEDLVFAVLSKPTYFIDDIKDANKFVGKYVFYDINGKRHGFAPAEPEEEKK